MPRVSTHESDPDIPFVVVAFEGGRNSPLGGAGGFLCVFDDQITFVRSRYVRYVMSLPLVGGLLPGRVRPSGPDDPRTVTRFPFSELQSVSDGRDAGFKGGAMRGRKVRVLGADDRSRFYDGGQLNPALTFDNLAPVVRGALRAGGFGVVEVPRALTVQRDT
jgi:hypothetical protein